MDLEKYFQKRNFKKTPEPKSTHASKHSHIFVVQKHQASHLHYDFRLQIGGLLKSWAIPKGPSLNPKDKRLAVEVEDHPYAYKDFEGEIPPGNYGAGHVEIWDTGTFHAKDHGRADEETILKNALKRGELTVVLNGAKLKGEFTLVRTKGKNPVKTHWLLIKRRDDFASASQSDTVLDMDTKASRPDTAEPRSVPGMQLAPMLATLADEPFTNSDWVYEMKWDGIRIIAIVAPHKEPLLLSRSGIDVTHKYPQIRDALKGVMRGAVLDGELVALDAEGRSAFQLVQNAQNTKVPLQYQVFDCLFVDNKDIRSKTLLERKRTLYSIIPPGTPIKISEHIVEAGEKLFEEAKRMGYEGIMAKKKDSPYRSGVRSDEWLKIKTHRRQEVVIVGFTEPKGERKYFGSLVLAVSNGAGFTYVGRAGSGFTAASLKEIYKKLKPLITKVKPVPQTIVHEDETTWVKPALVAEVKFAEWTRSGEMRQAIFVGLRDDKKPENVVKETEKHTPSAVAHAQNLFDTSPVPVTHTNKLYWQKENITKGDLLAYYQSVAPYLLPHLKDRPLTLYRQPQGADVPGFFQKNVDPSLVPDFVKTVTVKAQTTGKDVHYAVCNNIETLLWMVNLGCIEINPWLSTTTHLNNPSYFILDIDLGKKNTFAEGMLVARTAKDILDDAGLTAYVKTSGKTGLHVYVPIGNTHGYPVVHTFSKLVATLVHQELPQLTSLHTHKTATESQIFIDYLRNSSTQTAASVYSVRPFPGARVSMPLMWSELTDDLTPDLFTMHSALERIHALGDIWHDMYTHTADLDAALKKIEARLT